MGYFNNYFQGVADEYSGTYEVQEIIVKSADFSSIPITYHKLIIPIRDRNIFFDLEFGNHNMASVKSAYDLIHETMEFAIRKRNMYKLLFSRKQQSLMVEAKSPAIQRTIEQYLNEAGLEQIARTTLFEPSISFEENGDKTTITTNFSLAFADKEKSLRPLIEFYKLLTDYYG